MTTKLIDATVPGGGDLTAPARCLREGGLVVFPTETVYGLGANALDDCAVRAIFAAKGRPADNPLIVHIWDTAQLDGLVAAIPDAARRMMDALWPGPVTLVLPRGQQVAPAVTAGLDTVAVRMPSHPVARELLRLADVPVAAPSANTSTRPSPTTAAHVMEDMDGRVAYVIDGGPCDVGLESTVVDVSDGGVTILRPGGVPLEALESLVGHVSCDAGAGTAAPRSPGMKYKHYAPRCEMVVVTGTHIRERVEQLIVQHAGKRIGVLAASDITKDIPGAAWITACGAAPESYAHALFAALRDMDARGAELVIAEFPFTERGMGRALRNRIYKSAGGNVVQS